MIRKAGVGIVDYGSGNISSLRASLVKIGYRPQMLCKPEDFENAKVVVIPGVGAFPRAMERLNASGLAGSIHKAHEAGKRIVGICVGMQILAKKGFEIRETAGLGLLGGEVHYHPKGLQVGWMPLATANGHSPDIVGRNVYFNHSYHMTGVDSQVLYTCDRLNTPHAAIVRRDNIIGMQFHPEKSQHQGLELLGLAIRGEIQ